MTDRPTSDPVVVHNTDASRYEVFVDGARCGIAEYELDGDVIRFTHTFTDPPMRGHGIAALVVGRALDDARRAGRRVVPQCWYVAQYIDQHPDYADLLS
jgi:predicted GNAT family acetyltransferase